MAPVRSARPGGHPDSCRPLRTLSSRNWGPSRGTLVAIPTLAAPQMRLERVGNPIAQTDLLVNRRQFDGVVERARDARRELDAVGVEFDSRHGRLLPCGS